MSTPRIPPERLLEEQIIVATGEFHILSRASLRETIANAGDQMMGRITEATTLLVVGGPEGVSARKCAAAHREGVRIITEAELIAMLNR